MVTIQKSGAHEYLITLYKIPSPYRAVNTFHLGYKNQSVYAVSGTSRCLSLKKYITHCNWHVEFL